MMQRGTSRQSGLEEEGDKRVTTAPVQFKPPTPPPLPPPPQPPRRANLSTPQDDDIARVRELARQRLRRDAWIGRLEATVDFCCVWDCCGCWIAVQEAVKWFILDPFVDLFITICILLNTVCMAMDHEGIDKTKEEWLEGANMVFTIIFAAEALLKMIALSPKFYFMERWNCFDFLIAFISVVELCIEKVNEMDQGTKNKSVSKHASIGCR